MGAFLHFATVVKNAGQVGNHEIILIGNHEIKWQRIYMSRMMMSKPQTLTAEHLNRAFKSGYSNCYDFLYILIIYIYGIGRLKLQCNSMII